MQQVMQSLGMKTSADFTNASPTARRLGKKAKLEDAMPLTPILKKALGSPAVTPGKKVLFSPQVTPRTVILNYTSTRDPNVFLGVFQRLGPDNPLQETLMWFSQMTECVSHLDKNADKLITEFLKIPWHKSAEVTPALDNFILTLVTAHNYFTYTVLKQLFSFLIPNVDESESEELLVCAGAVTPEDQAMYRRVLNTIIAIHSHVPLSRDNLVVLSRKMMPYFKRHVHHHAVYTHNLLLLAAHLPHIRIHVLEIIITNMVTIDVHTPRSELALDDEEEEEESSDEEDMFQMEVDDGKDKPVKEVLEFTEDPPIAMSHRDGNTLDVLMTIMLQYVHDVCHGLKEPRMPRQIGRDRLDGREDELDVVGCAVGEGGAREVGKALGDCGCGGSRHDLEALKLLFSDLREVFSRIILCTQASSHVQFLMFYLVSIRPGLATIFLEFLRVKKFEDPNCARDTRRNAMAYVGSLLARGRCVPFSHVHSCLEIICGWCQTYLDNQERVRSTNYEDLVIHSPFYYACQTVFYVFTFWYKEYTENAKRLQLAKGLNLERLVHSPLNPLKVCAPPIVNNFAAVTRRFQLAYCYTIMENNKRMGLPTARQGTMLAAPATLDMFFPFDPYLLQRSKKYIMCHYRLFDGLPEDEPEAKDMEMDLDEDALVSIISPKSSSLETGRSHDFSYSSSPGYKHW